MTAAPSPAEPHWSRPFAERQIVILGELAEAGLEIALAIRDQVKTDTTAAENLPAAYARAARAVRLSLMLQDRLIQDLTRIEAEPVIAIEPPVVRERKTTIQNIVRRLGDCAQRNRERLDRMTTERLDRDVCGDLLAHPISEIVALICKDLGLTPDWPAVAEEAWAREEITGGKIGWPLRRFAKPADDSEEAESFELKARRSPKRLQ